MWITQRIGKNDGTKNSQKLAAFFQKCTKSHAVLANTVVLYKNIHTECNIK